MTDAELMSVVRLLTVVTLASNAVILGYGAVTFRPDRTFTEQWPAIAAWKRWIVAGLALEALGWTLHQAYWWVWQVAAATGAVHVAAWFGVHGSYIIPAHIIVMVGAVLVSAPVAQDLLGRHWASAVAGAMVAFSALGVGLLKLGGA